MNGKHWWRAWTMSPVSRSNWYTFLSEAPASRMFCFAGSGCNVAQQNMLLLRIVRITCMLVCAFLTHGGSSQSGQQWKLGGECVVDSYRALGVRCRCMQLGGALNAAADEVPQHTHQKRTLPVSVSQRHIFLSYAVLMNFVPSSLNVTALTPAV